MEEETPRFKILMFPWLAHGHIFPYLELAKRILVRKNFYIYFCSTAINFSSINDFLENNMLNNSIELVEIHLQPFPELPPHYHTTKNLPSNLISTLLKAFQTAKASLSNIVGLLEPDLVIFDIFQPWVANLASSQGIPAVNFAGFGAATVSIIHHHYGTCSETNANFPFPGLCLHGHEKENVDAFIYLLCTNVFDGESDVFFVNFKLSSEIVLLKTSYGFEGKYLDYVSDVIKKKVVAVGPLVTDAINSDQVKNSETMQWLSKKRQHSTVYVSFGSEYFLSKEQMGEMSKGLELCDVNFIWVIRFPVGEEISTREALPEGFLERVKERGLVVTGWAPQASILSHPSIGGFVSHCGWSSLTESVYFGVPIIGMPLKLNMFIDAKMVAEAGVCMVVPKNGSNEFEGEEIGKVINEVIAGNGVGERLRLKARELGDAMKREEGEALDEAAEQLWQICLKNKNQ